MISFDASLIDKCCEQDRMAQMMLYDLFANRIYNSCYRIVRNSQDAEEMMQESFLKVFANIGTYDKEIPFEAWFVRIAINTSIDKLRKKSPVFTDLNDNLGIESLEHEDEGEFENILLQVRNIKEAISRLSDADRLIITLYLIEGYDHEEISEILKIKVGTVRIQYMRAKKKLIKLLIEK